MSEGAQQSLKKRLLFLALDCCCIFLAYAVAVHVIDPGARLTFAEKAFIFSPYLVVFCVLWIGSSLDHHGISAVEGEDLPSYAVLVTKAVAASLIVSTVIMALFSNQGGNRQFLLAFGIGTFISVLGFRVLARLGIWGVRMRGLTARQAIVVGANERSERLLQTITTRDYLGYRVAGLLDDDETRGRRVAQQFKIPYLGPIADFDAQLTQLRPNDVFIALPIRSNYGQIQEIAERCESAQIRVKLVADLFPLRIATNRLMYVEDIPLLSLSAVPEERARLAAKRAVDLFVSTVLLTILAIPLLIVGIIIKLDSPGPVFFFQERVGQNQRRFKMIKFRSMVPDAEARRKEIEGLNEADGPVFKIKADPRLTRVGKFIRKYSVDELPQLFNVWLGQMSLVGPRPPIASEVVQYTWNQRRRLSVKPGMTGLWQVSGRSDVGFSEWVELDLKYIDTWSLYGDFVILLRTFRAVVQGRGAA